MGRRTVLIFGLFLMITALWLTPASPVRAAGQDPQAHGVGRTLPRFKRGLLPAAGGFTAAPQEDEQGNRHRLMNPHAKAVLPAHADAFTYLYEDGGTGLGLRPVGSQSSEATAFPDAPELTVYSAVWPGTDVAVHVGPKGYKDTLMLAKLPETNRWVYELVLDGLAPSRTKAGLEFIAEDGRPRFRLGDLYAYDAKGRQTPVHAALLEDGDALRLELTVAWEWLHSAAYPVMVDPSIVPITSGSANGNTITGLGSIARDTAGTLTVVPTTTGNRWPLLSADGGATWSQTVTVTTDFTHAQLVTVGTRTLFFYTDSRPGLFYRYHDGTSSTWSAEMTLATTAVQDFAATASQGKVMVLYAVSYSDVRVAASADNGGTWSRGTLPVTLTGTAIPVGLQYFNGKYVAVAEWRSVATYDITTEAVAFTAATLAGPWTSVSVWRAVAHTSANPGLYPSDVTSLQFGGSALAFVDSHYDGGAIGSSDPCAPSGPPTADFSRKLASTMPIRMSVTAPPTCPTAPSGSSPPVQMTIIHTLTPSNTWTYDDVPPEDFLFLDRTTLLPLETGNAFLYQRPRGFARLDAASHTFSPFYEIVTESGWEAAAPVASNGLYTINLPSSSSTTLHTTTSAGDTTAPAVSLALASSTVNDYLYVTSSISENHSLGPVAMTVDSAAVGSFRPSTQSVLSVGSLAEGTHTVTATVGDWNGNQGSGQRTFTVDHTAPTVAMVAPVNNGSLNPGDPLIATASDNVGLHSVAFIIGSTTVPAVKNGDRWEASWPDSLPHQGNYTIRAKATDLAGLTTTTAANAFYASPTVMLSVPDRTTVLSGVPLTLNAEVFQSGTWFGPEWKSVNDTGWSQAQATSGSAGAGAPFTLTWTPPATPGPYQVRIKFTDANNASAYAMVVLADPLTPSGFRRASVANRPQGGTSVDAGIPRVDSRGAVLIEAGTTNLVPTADTDALVARYTGGSARATFGGEFWRVPRSTAGGTKYTTVEMAKSYPVNAGETWTQSFYFRHDGTQQGFQVNFLMATASSTASHVVTPTIVDLGNGLKRAIATYSVATGEVAVKGLNLNLNATTDTWTYLGIKGVQLEKKTYATEYTEGTRATESLAVPVNGLFQPQQWTVEMEFEPTSPQAVSAKTGFLWTLRLDSQNYYTLRIGSDGRPVLAVASRGLETVAGASAPVLQVGSRYRIAVRGSDSQLALFVNGTLCTVANLRYQEPIGKLPPLMYFGSDSQGLNQANGLFRRIRISSRGRKDAEITGDASGDAWNTDPTRSEVEIGPGMR